MFCLLSLLAKQLDFCRNRNSKTEIKKIMLMKNLTGLFVWLFLFQNHVSAQITTESFLYKIGLKDSVYSEILSENREWEI